MKKYPIVIIVILCGIFQSFCHVSGKKENAVKPSRPTPSTLDSIQGSWTDVSDLSNNITISGRNVDEYYNGTELNVHDYFRIYFSDVSVDEGVLLSQSSVDTTATSGKYVIKVDNDFGDIFCYQINGFYIDDNATSLDMSLEATFGHRGVTVYKQH